MEFFVGTSGYSYKEWKGAFYPAKLPQKEMLPFYGQRFSTVEINNSFYKLPGASVVEAWTTHVPATFRFVLKAPQTITHRRRLKNVESETRDFLQVASALKRRRGPVLFQLPPNFKKDLPRLKEFLALLDSKTLAAFEFRHASWFEDEVYACLRKKSCALCLADAADLPRVDLVSTAIWGYVRLRRETYSRKQLQTWVERIRCQNWEKVFVFFKHEDTGTGPDFAARFLELVQKAA